MKRGGGNNNRGGNKGVQRGGAHATPTRKPASPDAKGSAAATNEGAQAHEDLKRRCAALLRNHALLSRSQLSVHVLSDRSGAPGSCFIIHNLKENIL